MACIKSFTFSSIVSLKMDLTIPKTESLSSASFAKPKVYRNWNTVNWALHTVFVSHLQVNKLRFFLSFPVTGARRNENNNNYRFYFGLYLEKVKVVVAVHRGWTESTWILSNSQFRAEWIDIEKLKEEIRKFVYTTWLINVDEVHNCFNIPKTKIWQKP